MDETFEPYKPILSNIRSECFKAVNDFIANSSTLSIEQFNSQINDLRYDCFDLLWPNFDDFSIEVQTLIDSFDDDYVDISQACIAQALINFSQHFFDIFDELSEFVNGLLKK